MRSSHFIADNGASLQASTSSSMPCVSDSGNSFAENQESDIIYFAQSFMRQMGMHTWDISVCITNKDNLVSLLFWMFIMKNEQL